MPLSKHSYIQHGRRHCEPKLTVLARREGGDDGVKKKKPPCAAYKPASLVLFRSIKTEANNPTSSGQQSIFKANFTPTCYRNSPFSALLFLKEKYLTVSSERNLLQTKNKNAVFVQVKTTQTFFKKKLKGVFFLPGLIPKRVISGSTCHFASYPIPSLASLNWRFPPKASSKG